MLTYIETLDGMDQLALQGEFDSLQRLSHKYKDEVRRKTDLILKRLYKS